MPSNFTSSHIPKLLCWLLIGFYVFALPYAIVLFDWLLNIFSLEVLKSVPIAVIFLSALCYFWMALRENHNYHLSTFVIPGVLILFGVFWLESNPIKYLHIPEYILLVWLLYFALRRDGVDQQLIIISAVICSGFLGVVDEVHQGMHPDRYYGWKDMLINLAGSSIGGLALNTRVEKPTSLLSTFRHSIVKVTKQSRVLLLSLLVSAYSVFKLFSVASGGSFTPHYPITLVVANVLIVLTSFLYVFLTRGHLRTDQEFELLIFWPVAILMLLHAAIALAYYFGKTFV